MDIAREAATGVLAGFDKGNDLVSARDFRREEIHSGEGCETPIGPGETEVFVHEEADDLGVLGLVEGAEEAVVESAREGRGGGVGLAFFLFHG